MEIVWGIVVLVSSLLAWGGQTLSWLAPTAAARLGLAEAEDTVEPVFWADIRGEALWDFLTLWTMVVAGVLLILDSSTWAYFGLVGGGMYLYFAGRGITTRLAMLQRRYRIGRAANVRAGLAMLAVWGVMAAVTIAAAARVMAGS